MAKQIAGGIGQLMIDDTNMDKETRQIEGWKIGPLVVEKRLSLTGALAILMSFSAVIGGWYSFNYRVQQNTKGLEDEQKEIDSLVEIQSRTNETLMQLNMTIGKLNQRMDDSKIGAPSDH